jgi:short-subunit dehydrogenase
MSCIFDLLPRGGDSGLAGRVVAITGAARGIGLATAHLLHERGARVAIGDIDGAAVHHAASEFGDGVLACSLDVTGVMIGMKLALPDMVKRRRGHIVNIASAAAKSPVPGAATYGASKAAVVSMTETARVEFAGSGVKFTCVMPSFTTTELVSGTGGMRFLRNATPSDVSRAIALAITSNRDDVFIPWVIEPVIWVQSLLGRRVRDAINRLSGADRTFLEVDANARAAYDARIREATRIETTKLRAGADNGV